MSTASVVFLASLVGGDASAAVGGPDAFGYSFADQADGAVYNYVDITATGMLLANADDTLAAATPLGAPFTFYGEVVNQLRASTNGFLTSTLGTNANFDNVCPLPAVQAGGGFRIAVLHDDLVTSVYYQYFNQAQAAAVGYPGQAAGISVFQWTGQHFGGAANGVNAEAILFHGNNRIVTMVQTDVENGLASTLGIQNADATVALQYSCNTNGGVIPGVTAVEYSLGGGMPPAVSINEIRIDQPGVDNDEYFELVGPPGTPLDGLHYIVVGDGAAGVSGFIEAVINLNGQVIPPSGYFVAGENTLTLAPRNFTAFLNFENSDTNTHMLVSGFTGVVGTQIDGNADGVPDNTPWTAVLDAVAIIDPDDLDMSYGPGEVCMAGPYCNDVPILVNPDHVFRCGDGNGGWNQGLLNHLAVPPSDSPGGPNPCVCGDGIVIAGESCDDAGESATCDADCTAPECGDGLTNMLAGEVCDDGVESATCDADCTAVVCGDGVVNMAAGEICDDAGESAACNSDCTVAACGDGVVNMAAGEECDDAGESASCDIDCTVPVCGDGISNPAAGEECDDAGESASCDDDCTAAACGDMNVNTTAGETCDDGGRSDTCNADCTVASCGDGLVNMTAGEECDGDGMGAPGETETCDDDCTTAMCGDMVANVSAGEECDDGGESKNCDDDCTLAECGDGAVNMTAGEECDDGNSEDGDGCSASCLMEEEPGTTGDDSSGGSTGVDTGVDETAGSGGESGVGTTGGPVTVSASAGNDSSSGGETDTDTGGATVPGDGCNCSTASEGTGRHAAWSVLALFGLGALRRRRRRA